MYELLDITVDRYSFQDIGLAPSIWYHRWLEPAPEGYEGSPRWVRCADVRLANDQHPDVYATLLEQERNILPRFDALRPAPRGRAEQPALFEPPDAAKA